MYKQLVFICLKPSFDLIAILSLLFVCYLNLKQFLFEITSALGDCSTRTCRNVFEKGNFHPKASSTYNKTYSQTSCFTLIPTTCLAILFHQLIPDQSVPGPENPRAWAYFFWVWDGFWATENDFLVEILFRFDFVPKSPLFFALKSRLWTE